MVKYVGPKKEHSPEDIIAHVRHNDTKAGNTLEGTITYAMESMEICKQELKEGTGAINYWRDIISACMELMGIDQFNYDDGVSHKQLRARVQVTDPIKFDFDLFKKALKVYHPDNWKALLKDVTALTITPSTVQLLYDEGEIDLSVMQASQVHRKSESYG